MNSVGLLFADIPGASITRLVVLEGAIAMAWYIACDLFALQGPQTVSSREAGVGDNHTVSLAVSIRAFKHGLTCIVCGCVLLGGRSVIFLGGESTLIGFFFWLTLIFDA